jgi:hypothetical protein
MRLWFDPNAATAEGKYVLTCAGTISDLSRQGVELQAGMAVTLCTEDPDDDGPAWLLVNAIVENDGKGFLASVDESTWRREKE